MVDEKGALGAQQVPPPPPPSGMGYGNVPMEVAQGPVGGPAQGGVGGGKLGETGKKFGKKLGNAGEYPDRKICVWGGIGVVGCRADFARVNSYFRGRGDDGGGFGEFDFLMRSMGGAGRVVASCSGFKRVWECLAVNVCGNRL